jgi:AbrB family looped-hinge helix DNA binding protein
LQRARGSSITLISIVNSPVDGLYRIVLGLADGKKNGIIYTMKTTIDKAGRLVIPKDIRRESGIKPGMPLDVRWENGTIAIAPTPLPVKLERKGRLLVAVPTKDTPRLSADTIERTRRRLRRERSAGST